MVLVVKNPPANAGHARNTGSIAGLGRSPGNGNLSPVFLPGKFHGQRSLVGYSPRGHKESDTTERLSACACTRTHTHTHTRTQLLYNVVLVSTAQQKSQSYVCRHPRPLGLPPMQDITEHSVEFPVLCSRVPSLGRKRSPSSSYRQLIG